MGTLNERYGKSNHPYENPTMLDSIENLRHFLAANQIHTLKVKDGVVVRLMEKGIVFED